MNVGSIPTEQALFFLHIPRTGGTSLIDYLDQKIADAANICPAHEMFQFERLQKEEKLIGYSFYRGHFGINLPRLIDHHGRIITFLRRPIPRLFSTWRHLHSQPVPFVGGSGRMVSRIQSTTAAAHNLDFEHFCYFIMKFQGPWFFNSITALCGHGRGSNLPQQNYLSRPQELLDQAKRSIDEFAFVGFTETFDLSVARLQRLFGWPAEPVSHVNAAPSHPPPAEGRFLRWLKFATRLDDQLYDYALQRQEQDMASLARNECY